MTNKIQLTNLQKEELIHLLVRTMDNYLLENNCYSEESTQEFTKETKPKIMPKGYRTTEHNHKRGEHSWVGYCSSDKCELIFEYCECCGRTK